MQTKAPGETFQFHVAAFLIVKLALIFPVIWWEEQHLMTVAVSNSTMTEELPKMEEIIVNAGSDKVQTLARSLLEIGLKWVKGGNAWICPILKFIGFVRLRKIHSGLSTCVNYKRQLNSKNTFNSSLTSPKMICSSCYNENIVKIIALIFSISTWIWKWQWVCVFVYFFVWQKCY